MGRGLCGASDEAKLTPTLKYKLPISEDPRVFPKSNKSSRVILAVLARVRLLRPQPVFPPNAREEVRRR